MVNVRMTVGDLASTRFAYSPLAEVGESLHLIAAGQVRGVHQEWYQSVRPALARVDMELLAVVMHTAVNGSKVQLWHSGANHNNQEGGFTCVQSCL